ncbi:MAG: hypothetical protein GY868_00385 [Deltaproteobacteria bacterium]|nr:hypothetical protein [Deltaproteobacteria bacterium]
MNETDIPKRLSYSESLEFLQELTQRTDISLLTDNRGIHARDAAGLTVATLRLPPAFPLPAADMSITKYLENVPSEPPACIILLIQAGAASLGCCESGSIIAHKTLTKYMVRKKQGKAQLTYLRTKGKSRAGSRMRLQAGNEFFHEINRKLAEWNAAVAAARHIFISCPVRLTNELFAAKLPPPFDRHDHRSRRVPFDVHIPSYKELKRIHYLLHAGYVLFP